MAKLNGVIDQLVTEGYLKPESRTGIAEVLAAEELGTAWYIHAALGISAWIAALFIIGFITTGVILTESALAYSITGLIFCGAAVGVKRLFPRSIFAGQLTLAVSLAGQGFLIAGIYLGTDSLVATCLITMLFEATLFLLYPGSLHRLISTLVILGALLVLLYGEWELYEATHVLVILLAGVSIVLWYGDTWFITQGFQSLTRPVGYAAVITLLGLLLPSTILDFEFVNYWWISTFGLLVAFLALIWLMVQTGGLNLSVPVMGALAGGMVVLSLVTWQAPGILGAMTLMTLGFWRGQRLVMGLATAFLAFFIGAFYYNLDLTLLEKSWILLATGVLFFIGRFFLKWQLHPAREVV